MSVETISHLVGLIPRKMASDYADGVYGPDDLAAIWNACRSQFQRAVATHTGPQAQEAGEWVSVAELRVLASDLNQSAIAEGEIGLRGMCIDARNRLMEICKRGDVSADTTPARVVSDDLAAAVAALKFDVYELTTPELQAAFDGKRNIAVVQIDTVKALKAALSTLQSGAEGKDGDSEIPVELQDAWDAIDDVTFGSLHRYAKDVIARYLTPGMKGHSRIVGSRKIDGVHVIIAKPTSDLLPEQLLVRYDDYLLATSGKHTANVPSLTVDETMSRAWGVPAGTYVLETTK